MLWNLTHSLHVLAGVLWVGSLVATIVGIGMLGREPDDASMSAYRWLSGKVVMWIHIAMLLSWATGIAMMFFFYGGFGAAGAHVDTMFMTALLMTVVLIGSMAGPAKRFSRAGSNSEARIALDGVRKYAITGLVLALLTVGVASFGGA